MPTGTKENGFTQSYLNAKEGLGQSVNRMPSFQLPPNRIPDLRASWALLFVRTLVRVLEECFALQILFLIALLLILLLALVFLKGEEWFFGLIVVDLEFTDSLHYFFTDGTWSCAVSPRRKLRELPETATRQARLT